MTLLALGRKTFAAVLLLLCYSIGCTTAPEGTQIQALSGSWQITELDIAGPRGDLTTALQSRYETLPTLTVDDDAGRAARYVITGMRTGSASPLRVEGQIEEVGTNTIAFVSGFETDIVWTLDVQTGTRARLASGPGLQGPAPLLRALLPSINWRDTEGARLQIERTD
ncbi:hypothetical protein CRI93_14425 [Longimonas halophila]|uniref:Lipocalin-like domain-containing protein n=1 Tax=Longimonas halophila TaxID=1469170 RepID=A0A2H3NIA5_9BACT|nr:hypothetical protein [Longimonas halophila]PEN04759.1 hypothetical protein CRI93_14425 [Longimonas halophila]